MNILIIEDDPDDALVIQRALRGVADTEFAESGAEGVRKATEGHFDIVVLDYRLGDLTGTEVMARLREKGQDVPVIVTSGMGSHFIVARTLALGARNFVSKDGPDFAKKLVEAIKEIASGEPSTSLSEKTAKGGGSSRAAEFRLVVQAILANSQIVNTIGVVGSDGALVHGHVRDKSGAEDVTAVLAGTVQMMLSTVAAHLGYGKARSIVASYEKGSIAMAPLRGNLAIYFTSTAGIETVDQLRAEIEAAAGELNNLIRSPRFAR